MDFFLGMGRGVVADQAVALAVAGRALGGKAIDGAALASVVVIGRIDMTKRAGRAVGIAVVDGAITMDFKHHIFITEPIMTTGGAAGGFGGGGPDEIVGSGIGMAAVGAEFWNMAGGTGYSSAVCDRRRDNGRIRGVR